MIICGINPSTPVKLQLLLSAVFIIVCLLPFQLNHSALLVARLHWQWVLTIVAN